jgi:hypothetical protein
MSCLKCLFPFEIVIEMWPGRTSRIEFLPVSVSVSIAPPSGVYFTEDSFLNSSLLSDVKT